MTLKELRMWHWKTLVRLRAQQNKHEQIAANWLVADKKLGYNNKAISARSLKTASNYQKQANFHMKAVQALNDVVPGTAEEDCANEAQHDAKE